MYKTGAATANIFIGTTPTKALMGTTASSATSLFTHTSPNRLTYNGLINKTFLINVNVGMTTSDTNTVIRISIAKNGISNNNVYGDIHPTTADRLNDASFNDIVSLTTGQYIELFTARPSGTGYVIILYASITIISLG
jgi:hypothetical protein